MPQNKERFYIPAFFFSKDVQNNSIAPEYQNFHIVCFVKT